MIQASVLPFRLLVITPEGNYPQEIGWVHRLFESGLETLHLRKPGWKKEQLAAYLEQLGSSLHAQVVVHHEAGLLESYGLKGVHAALHKLPHVKQMQYLTSCPAHSWEEFMAVEERVDYALVSPFFNSISKKGYAANQQLQQIPAQAMLHKAVALGGICADKLEWLREKGMGGAAFLGAVWQTANPLTAFLKILNKVENGR